jgi:hypothetical protein
VLNFLDLKIIFLSITFASPRSVGFQISFPLLFPTQSLKGASPLCFSGYISVVFWVSLEADGEKLGRWEKSIVPLISVSSYISSVVLVFPGQSTVIPI